MPRSVIAFDDSLLTVGAVAVQHDEIVAAATFVHDTNKLKGVEKYAWVAALQAADVAAFLERYNRDTPVIIEVGANANGTTWVDKDRRVILTDGIASGAVLGTAQALGFTHVEFIPVGTGGWGGKRNAFLADSFADSDILKTEHERDAAAMAAWWLARNGVR